MPERLARTDAATQVTEITGGGPFRFLPSERVSGARAVYARFEGYRPRENGRAEWTSGPKIVHCDRVEWLVIPDSATAAAALRNGEADWWENADFDLLPSLRGDANLNLWTMYTTGEIRVHAAEPVDAAVRQSGGAACLGWCGGPVGVHDRGGRR